MIESTSVEKSLSDNEFTYVCKFRAINENLLNLLPNLEIYIPTVAQLNDPLEGALAEGFSLDLEQPPNLEVESTESSIGEHFSELSMFKKRVTEYLQEVGVYSVSIHRKRWHASNFLPMWASYANEHKGVCMVFKRKPLTDERFKWVKVDYVTHPHNYSGSHPQHFLPDAFTQDFFANAQLKLSKKYDYWRHEHELRLIAQPGCTGHQQMDQFFDLHALVFGFSTNTEDVLKLLNKLPDEAKHKLMNSEDAGIYQVVKPDSLFTIRPLKNMRQLLKLA
jgi:hypothetical protein